MRGSLSRDVTGESRRWIYSGGLGKRGTSTGTLSSEDRFAPSPSSAIRSVPPARGGRRQQQTTSRTTRESVTRRPAGRAAAPCERFIAPIAVASPLPASLLLASPILSFLRLVTAATLFIGVPDTPRHVVFAALCFGERRVNYSCSFLGSPRLPSLSSPSADTGYSLGVATASAMFGRAVFSGGGAGWSGRVQKT